MKLYKAINLSAPLKDARIVPHNPGPAIEERIRDAEQAAYERGRRDAEKALSTQLMQQRAELLEVQQGIFTSLNNCIPQVIQETEKAVIELAFETAQRIVAGLPISTELVEATVQDALNQLENKSDLTVQLNPEDLALLRKNGSPVLEHSPGTDKIQFAAAPEVSRGGCVVLTRFGILDARRETKIEQLRKSLA